MKTIIITITLLTLTAFPLQSQKQTLKAKKSEPAVVATIAVNSVKCSMCASTVTDAVMELDGVKNVEVDVDEQVATVTYLSKKVKKADIEKAIANAGYNANEVRRDDEAYKKLPICCR